MNNTASIDSLDIVTHEAIYGRIDSNHTIDVNVRAHFEQELLIRPDGINLKEITLSALISEWMTALNDAKIAERKQEAWIETSGCAPCPQESAEIAEMFDDASAMFFELSEFLACSIRLDMPTPVLGAADPTRFIDRKHDAGVFCKVVGGILMTAQQDEKGRTVFGFCDLHDCQLRGGIVFISADGELEECINTDLSESRFIKGHEDFRYPDRAWIAKSRRAIK